MSETLLKYLPEHAVNEYFVFLVKPNWCGIIILTNCKAGSYIFAFVPLFVKTEQNFNILSLKTEQAEHWVVDKNYQQIIFD